MKMEYSDEEIKSDLEWAIHTIEERIEEKIKIIENLAPDSQEADAILRIIQLYYAFVMVLEVDLEAT
jgi:hypothetical protein